MSMPPRERRRVALISGHYLRSKRQAGFHHLARAYWRLGWEVAFITAPISLLSRAKGDYRFEYPVMAEANRLISVEERLTSFVLMTAVHPVNLRSSIANRLAEPLFARYARTSLGRIGDFLRTADLIVFESSAALLLVDRVREISPRARLVYRVSDDMRRFDVHPLILKAQAAVIPKFDLITTPSRYTRDALSRYGRIEVHHHAVDKLAFDRATVSPYGDRPAAVFVGVSPLFDYDTLAIAARVAPHVDFHILGLAAPRDFGPNVVFHGEIPFEQTVPYLQHATMGLNLFPRHAHIDELRDGSLKNLQYSYCRLPIVAPSYLEGSRPNLCIFEPGDEASVQAALSRAEHLSHSARFAEGIRSWEDLARVLAGDEDATPAD
jgi:2-beta-glucuronyltransferase